MNFGIYRKIVALSNLNVGSPFAHNDIEDNFSNVLFNSVFDIVKVFLFH